MKRQLLPIPLSIKCVAAQVLRQTSLGGVRRAPPPGWEAKGSRERDRGDSPGYQFPLVWRRANSS